MTKMLQYVEDMSARLAEVAATEQTLIRALGDALSRVDQELLADVRDLTMAHEARRVAILTELQGLAQRIGSFPGPAEVLPSIEDGNDASEFMPAETAAPPRAGDWRQAITNMQEDLSAHFGR